jgi:hypothetical protein
MGLMLFGEANREAPAQGRVEIWRGGGFFQPPFYSSGFDLRKAFPIDSGAPAVGTAAAPGP